MATDGIFGKIYDYCDNSSDLIQELGGGGGGGSTGTEYSQYCSQEWRSFWAPFIYIHEELELGVCVVGSLLNVLNLLVFTQKNMQSATSSIFTALAFADFLFVSQQVVISSLIVSRKYRGDSRSPTQLLIEKVTHLYCFEIFHGWSIYLTLLVAIWRYIGVIHPFRCRQWCTRKTAKWAIVSTLCVSTVVISLICLLIQLQECKGRSAETRRQHYLVIYVLVVKVIPCLLLTFFSIALVYSLAQAKKNRILVRSGSFAGEKILEQLVVNTTFSISVAGQHSSSMNNNNNNNGHGIHPRPCRDQIDRTTRTLVVLLLLFLFTETPFGILELASISRLADERNPTFYMDCYFPVLSFLVFDELISSSFSFFVFIFISKAFRHTFISMTVRFFKRCLPSSRPPPRNQHPVTPPPPLPPSY